MCHFRFRMDNVFCFVENPGIWYLAEGGITSLGIMLEDLEAALL